MVWQHVAQNMPRGIAASLVAAPVDPVDHVIPALPRVERHPHGNPHKKNPHHDSEPQEEDKGSEHPDKPHPDHIVDDYA